MARVGLAGEAMGAAAAVPGCAERLFARSTRVWPGGLGRHRPATVGAGAGPGRTPAVPPAWGLAHLQHPVVGVHQAYPGLGASDVDTQIEPARAGARRRRPTGPPGRRSAGASGRRGRGAWGTPRSCAPTPS